MKIMNDQKRYRACNFYDENDNLVKNNITNDVNDNKILNVQSIELNDEPSTMIIMLVIKIYVDNKTDNFYSNFLIIRNEHVLTAKGHINMNDLILKMLMFYEYNRTDPQVNSHPSYVKIF